MKIALVAVIITIGGLWVSCVCPNALSFLGLPPVESVLPINDTAITDAFIAELRSSDRETKLAACRRAGNFSWALIRGAATGGNAHWKSYARLVEELKRLVTTAKTRDDKLFALTAWSNMAWCHYAPARALAREALFSDDRELIALSLPLIPATRESEAESLDRMLAVAQYPECEAAVLKRFGAIYGEKGFPWGNKPDERVFRLAVASRKRLNAEQWHDAEALIEQYNRH